MVASFSKAIFKE